MIRPKCDANAEYSACPSACTATCNDLRYPLPKPPKACILLCKSGCFCKKGFYRADDGSCVAPNQCCGENETYKTCAKQCIVGCSDYVRQSNTTVSPCIRRDDCSEPCEEDD